MPRTKDQEPRTKNHGPRTKDQEPDQVLAAVRCCADLTGRPTTAEGNVEPEIITPIAKSSGPVRAFMEPSTPLPRRLRRALAFVAAVALLLAVAGGVWLRRELQASLPTLDGAVRLSGLSAAVSITRDSLGIPTIRGTSREDVARATGFLHAQDRFFQMDLTRRRAAGSSPSWSACARCLSIARCASIASAPKPFKPPHF